MKMLVLGAGLQGCACAFDLLRDREVTRVTLADLYPDRAARFLTRTNDSRLHIISLDVTDHAAVAAVMRDHDAVMSAIPYYFNGPMAKLAVASGCHFADLGGNTEIVMEQKRLEADAHAKGLSVMPDCGLAPGMVNILAAEGIRRLDRADRVRLMALGQGWLAAAEQDPARLRLLFAWRLPTELDAASLQAAEEFQQELHRLIAHGKQEGSVRAGVVELWTMVWLTLVSAAVERVASKEWSARHPHAAATLEAAWEAIAWRPIIAAAPGRDISAPNP